MVLGKDAESGNDGSSSLSDDSSEYVDSLDVSSLFLLLLRGPCGSPSNPSSASVFKSDAF